MRLEKTVLGRTGKTQRMETPVDVSFADNMVRFFDMFIRSVLDQKFYRCKKSHFFNNMGKNFAHRPLNFCGRGFFILSVADPDEKSGCWRSLPYFAAKFPVCDI